MKLICSIIIFLMLNASNLFSQIGNDTLRTHAVSGSFHFTEGTFSSNNIDSNSLENFKTRNLSDILQDNSGIYIKKYHPGLATVSFRGTNASQTQIYWNDIPVNSSTLGESDLSLFPIAFSDDIQIQHGASGIYASSGGIGGSVNLSSKPTFNLNKPIIELTQSYGSFSNYNSLLSGQFSNKKISSRTTILYHKGKNNYRYFNPNTNNYDFLKNSEQEKYGISQTLSFLMNPKNIFSIDFYSLLRNQNIPPIIDNNNDSQNQIDKVFRVSLKWKTILKSILNETQFAYSFDQLNYSDSISNIDSKIQSNFLFIRNNSKFKLFDKGEVNIGVSDKIDFVNSSGFTSLIQRNQLAFYTNIQSNHIKKTLINFTLRQEIVDSDLIPIIPSLGIRYTINESINLKMNTTRNYKVPTLNELYWNPGGNINLEPESGWSNELSFVFKNKSSLNLNITGYYLRVENWIQWFPNQNNIWSPENINSVISKGVELDVSKPFFKDKIYINTSYVFADTRNIKTNFILPYVPKHKLTYSVFVMKNKWRFNVSQSLNSKTFVDASNQYYMPSYFPLSTSISRIFDVRKATFKLNLRVNNLFNEDYQIIANRPMPKSNFEVSLTIKNK